MPTGVYIRTKEHRRHISEARKGKPLTKEHRRNIGLSLLGRPMSPNARLALKLANENQSQERREISRQTLIIYNRSRKGIPHSKEHNEKVAEANRGKHRSEETKHKISEFMKTRPVLQSTRDKLSAIHKGRIITWGDKISKSLTGKKLSEEHVNNLKEAFKNRILPFNDTGIEVTVQDYLSEKGIEFEKHKSFKIGPHTYHRVDLWIPCRSLAIECDGDYWHNLPNVIEHDNFLNNRFFDQGISLLRLSGNEIESNGFISRFENELGM
jgi:hypothetical protein